LYTVDECETGTGQTWGDSSWPACSCYVSFAQSL